MSNPVRSGQVPSLPVSRTHGAMVPDEVRAPASIASNEMRERRQLPRVDFRVASGHGPPIRSGMPLSVFIVESASGDSQRVKAKKRRDAASNQPLASDNSTAQHHTITNTDEASIRRPSNLSATAAVFIPRLDSQHNFTIPESSSSSNDSNIVDPTNMSHHHQNNQSELPTFIPTPVAGMPSYRVRWTYLQAHADEAFLSYFRTWTLEHQTDYLDRYLGHVDSSHGHTRNRLSQNRISIPAADLILRDPAPYTGYHANVQHLESVAENSEAEIEEDDSPRTVLHDPMAHHSAIRATTTETASTMMPPVSSLMSFHGQGYQSAQSQLASSSQDHLAFTDTRTNEATLEVLPRQGRDFTAPSAPQMARVRGTGPAYPPSHASFAHHDDHYGQHVFDPSYNQPGPSTNHSSLNPLHQLSATQERNDRDNFAASYSWFHQTHPANDRNLQAVAAEIHARNVIIARNNAGSSTTARTARPLPTPIGHERAVAAGRAAPATNLRVNPSAQDGIDLMSGVITNFRDYTHGTGVGGPFAHWTRPAEHVIDNTPNGNNSFFDQGWGAPPDRVGRDPRYQQSRTSDGRATYFEDPARGVGRH